MAEHSKSLSGIYRACTCTEVSEQCRSCVPLGNIAAGIIHRTLDHYFCDDGFLSSWKITFQPRQRGDTHRYWKTSFCNPVTLLCALPNTGNLGSAIKAHQRISTS